MKKKILYVTFNDSPGGIYISQVIDVVKLYKENDVDANLIAFVSIRNYIKESKKIKSLLPKSKVFPSFPKLKFWSINKFWLVFIHFSSDCVVVARNVFAFNLLLGKKNQIKCLIYDGRGAVFAEHQEYNVYRGTGIEKYIYNLEYNAIHQSDYRIAVSNKLVEYWVEKYDYLAGKETIMPCTISNDFNKIKNDQKLNILRNKLGIKKDDIVLIYSGSIAGWQSFSSLGEIVKKALSQGGNIKMIFLSPENSTINKLKFEYPDHVFQLLVSHKEVVDYLDISDFGLLIRDNTITNKVSSPVKCAEYLSRGLKVLISSGIGDYSKEIMLNNLGYVIDNKNKLPILSTIIIEKDNQRIYASKNLSKKSKLIINNYLNLLDL